MLIRLGTTRAVILLGPWAIKIALLRPLWILNRILHFGAKKEIRYRLSRHAPNPVIAALKYIFIGALSNWREYRLWTESPRPFMVPTIFSLFGLVNIQERGREILESELVVEHPFARLLKQASVDAQLDFNKPTNFCRLRGRIVLVDYGGMSTVELFQAPVQSPRTLSTSLARP